MMNDRPNIKMARVEYIDKQVVLFLEDAEHTTIEFNVDPVGMAILGLTMRSVMQLALVDLKQKYPEPDRPTIPDSLEGL